MRSKVGTSQWPYRSHHTAAGSKNNTQRVDQSRAPFHYDRRYGSRQNTNPAQWCPIQEWGHVPLKDRSKKAQRVFCCNYENLDLKNLKW